MADEIQPDQAAVAAFGLMQHLLQLLARKGVISATELAGLFAAVRREVPSDSDYDQLALHLEALINSAREDVTTI